MKLSGDLPGAEQERVLMFGERVSAMTPAELVVTIKRRQDAMRIMVGQLYPAIMMSECQLLLEELKRRGQAPPRIGFTEDGFVYDKGWLMPVKDTP